jgi:hypothetical protein
MFPIRNLLGLGFNEPFSYERVPNIAERIRPNSSESRSLPGALGSGRYGDRAIPFYLLN